MKDKNKLIGFNGEEKAQEYLKKHKYKIIETNYKTKIGEIDIICFDKSEKCFAFVEVKTRSSTMYGLPREAVDKNKQNKIRLVATEYAISKKIFNQKLRFDVIEILDEKITHIKNAFWIK